MSTPEITEFECKEVAPVSPNARTAEGVPAETYRFHLRVSYPDGLDRFAPGMEKRLAMEVEEWRERQALAEDWRSAAEASGALDWLRDDPLIEDG